MEHLNLFIAQIAVIFLPGIMWAKIDARYAGKGTLSSLDFVISTFVFGVVAYAATFLLYSVLGRPFYLVDFKDAQDKTVLTGSIGFEIMAATVVGFLLSIVWLYATNYKLLTRLLQTINATKRYGDEDVWDFTFNSSQRSAQFVNVRDFDKKIVYTGLVSAFSESGKLRELTLYDVKLYDFEGNFMFDVPRLYIARKPDDLHIEFPLN